MEQRETKPWDQMEGEPDRDYARFMKWMELSERRMKYAVEYLDIKLPRAWELSTKWQWMSRAAAYDKEHAVEMHEGNERIRVETSRQLWLGLLETAQAFRDVPADQRASSQDLQRVAGAIKSIAPGYEVSVSQNEGDGEDEVTIALKRSRELESDGNSDD